MFYETIFVLTILSLYWASVYMLRRIVRSLFLIYMMFILLNTRNTLYLKFARFWDQVKQREVSFSVPVLVNIYRTANTYIRNKYLILNSYLGKVWVIWTKTCQIRPKLFGHFFHQLAVWTGKQMNQQHCMYYKHYIVWYIQDDNSYVLTFYLITCSFTYQSPPPR